MYYNSELFKAIRLFETELPNTEIVKTEVTQNKSDTLYKFTFYSRKEKKEKTHVIKLTRPAISEIESNIIKSKLEKRSFDEVIIDNMILDEEEKNIIVSYHYKHWGQYSIDAFNRNTHRLQKYWKTKKEMSFDDLCLYLNHRDYFNHFPFYVDAIPSKYLVRTKYDSLDVKLFLIYMSRSFKGVLPDYFHVIYEKMEPIDYRELWEKDKFLYGVNLKDPNVFAAFVIDDSFEQNRDIYDYQNALQNKLKREYCNLINTAYKINGLPFNSKTKNTHYIYSILKYYSKLHLEDWFKIDMLTISKIRSIPHPKIREIYKYLIDNEVIEMDETTKPMSYKVLK